jgi:hypothetical protein
MWEISAVSISEWYVICGIVLRKQKSFQANVYDSGTYVLAHNGSSGIIMLKDIQFRSLSLSEDIFKTGKVVEPEHCFIFYTFGVAITNLLQTPCNVAVHHYHYDKSLDLLVGVHGIIILKLIFKTRVLEFVLYLSGFG